MIRYLIMDVLYKAPFRKFVKKQGRGFQLAIEDEVELIRDNPDIGSAKKGDLSEFMVHKFIFQRTEYLIAYRRRINILECYMIGTHENFYRELKRYGKEAK